MAGLEALNDEQREAVQRALAAEDVFCVHGPPGTGKSTVLAAVARAAVGQGQLLCTAASNAAVDHLLELCLAEGLRALRIGHPARVSPRLTEHTLDVQVEQHPDRQLARSLFDEAFALLGHARKQRTRGRSAERFANARAAQAEARRLMNEARGLERKAVRDVARSGPTCSAPPSLRWERPRSTRSAFRWRWSTRPPRPRSRRRTSPSSAPTGWCSPGTTASFRRPSSPPRRCRAASESASSSGWSTSTASRFGRCCASSTG